MAFADHLPVNEALGVFVGVAGMDWLADGQAEPLKALLAAVVSGAAIVAVRQWRKRRRKD